MNKLIAATAVKTMPPEQRKEFADRVEVLEKVKAILTVPYLCMATTEQVAEYFGVPASTIQSVYTRNKKELDANGAVLITPGALDEQNLQNASSVQTSRTTKLYCVDDVHFTLNNRGGRFYPPRAILCIAMMLRDSEVAAEIRTQLLNLVEATPAEVKTANLVSQEDAMLKFAQAMLSGDSVSIAQAVNEMMALKDHTIAAQAASIEKLSGEKTALGEKVSDLGKQNDVLSAENTSLSVSNKMLAKGISTWSPRKTTNAIIAKIAKSIHGGKYALAWNEFYRNLRYEYGINLLKRKVEGVTGKKNASALSAVREDEWPVVMKALAALAYRYAIDVVDATNENVVDEYHLDRVETPEGTRYNRGILRTVSNKEQKPEQKKAG